MEKHQMRLLASTFGSALLSVQIFYYLERGKLTYTLHLPCPFLDHFFFALLLLPSHFHFLFKLSKMLSIGVLNWLYISISNQYSSIRIITQSFDVGLSMLQDELLSTFCSFKLFCGCLAILVILGFSFGVESTLFYYTISNYMCFVSESSREAS